MRMTEGAGTFSAARRRWVHAGQPVVAGTTVVLRPREQNRTVAEVHGDAGYRRQLNAVFAIAFRPLSTRDAGDGDCRKYDKAIRIEVNGCRAA